MQCIDYYRLFPVEFFIGIPFGIPFANLFKFLPLRRSMLNSTAVRRISLLSGANGF